MTKRQEILLFSPPAHRVKLGDEGGHYSGAEPATPRGATTNVFSSICLDDLPSLQSIVVVPCTKTGCIISREGTQKCKAVDLHSWYLPLRICCVGPVLGDELAK